MLSLSKAGMDWIRGDGVMTDLDAARRAARDALMDWVDGADWTGPLIEPITLIDALEAAIRAEVEAQYADIRQRLAEALPLFDNVLDKAVLSNARGIELYAAVEVVRTAVAELEGCEVPGCGHGPAVHTRYNEAAKAATGCTECACVVYVKAGEEVTEQRVGAFVSFVLEDFPSDGLAE